MNGLNNIPDGVIVFFRSEEKDSSIKYIFGDDKLIYINFGAITHSMTYDSFLAMSVLLPDIAKEKVKPHITNLLNHKQN